ncbi:hypothetical protein BYT27DRAFT_7261985 [Phlegmacium glaucopus]|nr:hypothetical protein BYT27DRAFT_7261985 [Phlegmacium glaucopus]
MAMMKMKRRRRRMKEMGVNVALNYDDTDDACLQPSPARKNHRKKKTASDNEANIPTPSTSLSVETDTESGTHTRSQVAAYAGIVDTLASFAGAIGEPSSRRFDYTNYPLHIFNFYLCNGQFTPQRGLAPQLSYTEYHQSAWYGGARFKHGDTPLSFEGLFRMDMTDDKTDDQEICFIPPLEYARACPHPFYRDTRRCVAYPYQENVKNRKDVKKPTMFFLKDPWQEESPRTARKVVIYQMLKGQVVKHVASMPLGGGVPVRLETETRPVYPASHSSALYHERFLITGGHG